MCDIIYVCKRGGVRVVCEGWQIQDKTFLMCSESHWNCGSRGSQKQRFSRRDCISLISGQWNLDLLRACHALACGEESTSFLVHVRFLPHRQAANRLYKNRHGAGATPSNRKSRKHGFDQEAAYRRFHRGKNCRMKGSTVFFPSSSRLLHKEIGLLL